MPNDQTNELALSPAGASPANVASLEKEFGESPTSDTNAKSDLEKADFISISAPPQLSSARLYIIFFCLALGMAMAAMRVIQHSISSPMLISTREQSIIASALASISSSLGGGSDQAYVGSGYSLAFAACLPVVNRLSDIFGRKWFLLGMMVEFMLASLACGLSQNMNQLIAFRVFQGVGGAALFTIPQSIACDVVAIEQRPKYQIIFEIVMMCASGIAPVFGGALADAAWRWCFYLNLPLGGIIFLLCMWQLPSRQSIVAPGATCWIKMKQIDGVGILLIAASTVCILYAANAGGVQAPWDSAQVVASFTVGGVALVLFVIYEVMYPPLPVIPMHLFKLPSVTGVYISQFFFGISYYLILFEVPLFLQLTKGLSALLSGVVLIAIVLPICPGVALSLIVLRRTGRYVEMIYVFTGIWTIANGLLSTIDDATSLYKIVGYLVLAGVGIGPTLQTGIFACQAAVKRKEMPVVTGGRVFVRFVGSAVGIVIGSAITSHYMFKSGLPKDIVLGVINVPLSLRSSSFGEEDRKLLVAGFVKGFQTLCIISASLSAASAVCAFFLIKQINLKEAHAK